VSVIICSFLSLQFVLGDCLLTAGTLKAAFYSVLRLGVFA